MRTPRSVGVNVSNYVSRYHVRCHFLGIRVVFNFPIITLRMSSSNLNVEVWTSKWIIKLTSSYTRVQFILLPMIPTLSSLGSQWTWTWPRVRIGIRRCRCSCCRCSSCLWRPNPLQLLQWSARQCRPASYAPNKAAFCWRTISCPDQFKGLRSALSCMYQSTFLRIELIHYCYLLC